MKLLTKLTIAVTCMYALLPTSLAATEVGGTLPGDQTWDKSGSPYLVFEQLVVPGGTTLTIQEGTEIHLSEQVSIVIEGTLLARGTAEAPITFVGNPESGQPARWGALRFADSSVDAAFTNVDDYQSGSIVEGCIFEMASNALFLLAASPYVHECTFRDNRTPLSIDIEGGAAIYVGPDSAPRIRDCIFEDNFADGFNYGGAIYVDAADPIIQDNIFTNNIAIYGGAISTLLMAAPIVGNHFENNQAAGSSESKGGAVSLVSSISALIANNFESNSSVKDGGGLHVCIDCFPHATPFVIGNTVVNNTCSNEKPEDGAAGVGAAFLRAMYGNHLAGNTRNGLPSDFGWLYPLTEGYPDWVANFSAPLNWWGTTDDPAIQTTITDGNDVEGLGLCDHRPALDAAPKPLQPVVTITTRRLVYDEQGLPMPLFLTIYNPGPEVEADLLVLFEYEGRSPVPFEGPVDFQGATRNGPFTRLTLPENSVFFTTLAQPQYNPTGTPPGHFLWRASLHDTTTGERFMESALSRSDLKEVGP